MGSFVLFCWVRFLGGGRWWGRRKKVYCFHFHCMSLLTVRYLPAFWVFSFGVLHFFCYFTGVNIWLYCYSQVHNTPVYFLRERTIDPIFLLPYPNTKSKSTLVKKNSTAYAESHILPTGPDYGRKNRRKEGGKK